MAKPSVNMPSDDDIGDLGPGGNGRSASSDDLGRQMQQLRDDLAALSETVKSYGLEQLDSVTETVRSAVGGAGDSMRMRATEARERGEQYAEEMQEAIQRNPLSAVMIALGLGFLVGAMWRR